MNKHYLPIALALATFTAAGTVPALAQQSGWGAGISTRSGTPYVHTQSTNVSGYGAHAQVPATPCSKPATKEYLARLDDTAFGPASDVMPKFVSPSDPAARKGAVAQTRAQHL
jgi:hypothetical protein